MIYKSTKDTQLYTKQFLQKTVQKDNHKHPFS